MFKDEVAIAPLVIDKINENTSWFDFEIFSLSWFKMSWQLMTDKSKKKRKGAVDKDKLHQLKKHFDR